MSDYQSFIESKSQMGVQSGFDPTFVPDFLFDFQKSLVEWSVNMGRCAIFADCGLGKTPMQLVWAENVVRKTGKPVMLATPLAVGSQTALEAEKFGIDATRTRNGDWTGEAKIWITNYEQLHHYDPNDFAGFVGDESSCIKDAKTARKAAVVEFTRLIPYRLLCTATAAPNDFWELGTSSETLGLLGHRDMITKFFKQIESGGRRFSKDGGWGSKFRFRGHAEEPFWSWVCSWARSIRKPSDLGGDDSKFSLPGLVEKEIVVKANKLRPGELFSMPARDMREEREERRRTIAERCEKAAEIATSCEDAFALWCTLNDESKLLTNLIPDCKEVSGSMSDEEKEEVLIAFSSGELKRIVTKPKIGAWGLNWQHCSNTAVFPSHSYEQYYQLMRRFYRFGQKDEVNAHIIISEGEMGILSNLRRKQQQSDEMFSRIVAHMKDSLELVSHDSFPEQEIVPSWL